MQPADLDAAPIGHAWEWLVDLPQRLQVVVELIDDRQTPLFSARSTPAAVAIRRLIEDRDPILMSAVAEALQSAPTSRVVVAGFHVLCVRLPVLGVLVLAIETISEWDDERWHDLEMVGSWIVNALETSLTASPGGPAVEPYRMASLQRMLTDAVARGSVRKVIGTFVEALGVWDEVRVDVYAASATNGFFRYVSPMGALLSSPPTLDARAIGGENRIVRCSRADVERIGLDPESGDLLLLRIPTGDVSWVLLFSGAIDNPKQVRLALYVELLREALTDVIASTIGRTAAAITGEPLPTSDALADATRMVLAQLTAVVGAQESALVVAAATGRQTLAVGDTGLLQSRADHEHDRLVVTSSDSQSAMTVVMERRQPRFTAVERAAVHAAASALHPRVQDAIQASRDGERRRQFRPVDSLFDQLAADTVGAGQPASVIVVSIDPSALGPGLLYDWLVKIREQLRAGDFAGILSHTEIAVLLNDASADQAAVVSARLKALLQSDEGDGLLLNPVFRMMTRLPEATFEGSLVRAARAGSASVN